MKNKHIIILLTFALIALSITGCSKKVNWDKEEKMGEISIDPNDTESLAPPSEDTEEKSKEEIKKDFEGLVDKEDSDLRSFMVHNCTYSSKTANITLKAIMHNLTEDHAKNIRMQIIDSSENIIAESNINVADNPEADITFSIEAKIPEEIDIGSISVIKLFAE